MTPHHHAAERRRQGGNEEPVILARDRTRDRAGGVATEAVRHDPLAVEQDFARALSRVPMHHAQSHLFPSVTAGRSTTAHSAGMRQFLFESSGGGSPAPP